MDVSGKVLLARLYQRTSANGNVYYGGRLGAARVVMFRDQRAEGDDPVWELFVQGDDRTAERPRPPAQDARPGPRRPAPAHPVGRGDGTGTAPARSDLDDPLPPGME